MTVHELKSRFMSLEIMVMTVMTKRNGMNGISRGPHRERQGLSQMKEVHSVFLRAAMARGHVPGRWKSYMKVAVFACCHT